MTVFTKTIHFLYFLLVLAISIIAGYFSRFFVVDVIVFTILIKPVMNK